MSSFKPKQFGLIVKKKAAATVTKGEAKQPFLKKSIFSDESDEDLAKVETAQEARKRVNAELMNKNNRKQVDQSLDAVLGVDPSAFAYDEVYDDMQATKAKAMGEKTKDRKAAKAKPKYINALLEKSNERKLEYERFVERKVQKERDAEGDEFEGKEKFITSAYKKKLEERRQAEEEEKRRAAQEAKDDVRNQSDLSGFYRNLLTSNVAMGADVKDSANATDTASEPTIADKARAESASAMSEPADASDGPSEQRSGRQSPAPHGGGNHGNPTHGQGRDTHTGASTRTHRANPDERSPRAPERTRERTRESSRSRVGDGGGRRRSRSGSRSRRRSRSRSRNRDRRTDRHTSDRHERRERSHRVDRDENTHTDNKHGTHTTQDTRGRDSANTSTSKSSVAPVNDVVTPSNGREGAQEAAAKAKAVMSSKRNTEDRIAMAKAKALARKQRGTKRADVGMQED